MRFRLRCVNTSLKKKSISIMSMDLRIKSILLSIRERACAAQFHDQNQWLIYKKIK